MSRREDILAALTAVLTSSLSATVRRNEVLPEKVPPAGLVILRDGTPGEPDVTLNPRMEFYSHRVEIEAYVQRAADGGGEIHDTASCGLAGRGRLLHAGGGSARACGVHRARPGPDSGDSHGPNPPIPLISAAMARGIRVAAQALQRAARGPAQAASPVQEA